MDEELKKSFKVYIDDQGFLNLKYLKDARGEEDIAQAKLIKETILDLFAKKPDKKYNTLVDTMRLQHNSLSSKSRKVYAELLGNKQFGKIVFLGKSVFFKVVGNFLALAVKRTKDIKWFSEKEKALKWLSQA